MTEPPFAATLCSLSAYFTTLGLLPYPEGVGGGARPVSSPTPLPGARPYQRRNVIAMAAKKGRWPLRYRLAHRAHCYANRLHNSTGQHRITWWLNCKAGSLWIDWWMAGGRHDYDYRGSRKGAVR